MTRPEVISHLCETVSLVFLSRGDFSKASDCFCDNSPDHFFQHQGETLEYVRKAVEEKLIRDGFALKYPAKS